MNIQMAAKMEPAMVTARQPYLFTKEDEIGPFENTINALC